ncbi:MAG: hypothetical protein IPJ65_14350 [Archangiaceae bacterium]|nr:hypothetical protein [Archangiaceae bacterium]
MRTLLIGLAGELAQLLLRALAVAGHRGINLGGVEGPGSRSSLPRYSSSVKWCGTAQGVDGHHRGAMA